MQNDFFLLGSLTLHLCCSIFLNFGFFASLLTEITVDTKSIRGQKTIFSVAVLANTRLTTINLEDKAEVKVD